MEKNDLFIKDETIELSIGDMVFGFKRITAGDELDWLDDYVEVVEKKLPDGTIKRFAKENSGRLMMCKLRNIVTIPYTDSELEAITGSEKPWKEYSNADKDMLFRMLRPEVLNELIKQIDASKDHGKKG